MKFLTSQLSMLLAQRGMRGNLRALLQYFVFLGSIIAVYSVLFHVLMLWEGQRHTWLTGVYWTLTVMSTLGFGDITFHTDLGRLFSIVVLLSGIVLLLILLPFVFIRSFYAPWLEAQLRVRAPRWIDEEARDHVIFCHYDEIARGLVAKLRELGIACYVIEPDPAAAVALLEEGVPVVAGEIDSAATWEALRVGAARLVVANAGDAANSNIALTVREANPRVPIAAFAEDMDSVDVLELSGANHVIPLKHRLGESLASRVSVGPAQAQVVGRYKDLRIAEFPVETTGLAGRTIRDTRLREITGLNLVACWERGRLVAARADTVLSPHSVAVVVGTPDQLAELDALFVIYQANENPVLVIGGGKVGRATCRALKRRGVAVNLLERNPSLKPWLEPVADRVLIGDAVDREVILKAGLEQAPSVVLTTNDDAMNIFLAVYSRRLNPEARIVSRINRERNLDAIHRAGADSVLSWSTLGVKSLLSLVIGAEASFLGEGVDLFVERVPRSLAGMSLKESGIAERTGVNVVAVQDEDGAVVNARAMTELGPDCELVLLGSPEQRRAFHATFAD